MPSTLFSPPKITIRGPFWTAEASVVAGPPATLPGSVADAARMIYARQLFVEDEARAAFGYDQVHLPGTLIALCFVHSVNLRPDDSGTLSYEWKRARSETVPIVDTVEQMRRLLYEQQGQLALLLLEAKPEKLSDKVFTCLAGEINLGVLQPQRQALTRLYRALDLHQVQGAEATTRWAVSVHSSGLSIFGQASLPWEKDRLAAPFQLARIWPDPPVQGQEKPHSGFRLTIESDRLTVQEKDNLLQTWRRLGTYLSPKNPLIGDPNSPLATPTWVTLEIANPLALPRLFWEISPWQEQPLNLPLHFERTELNLLLTDQQPYNPVHRPTSLGQFLLDDILITRDGTAGLEISVRIGPTAGPNDRMLRYHWSRQEPAGIDFQEQCTFSGMEVAFNPVETSEFLRNQQQLPIPEWLPDPESEPVELAVLWGFMPLEDGWAQLPVPNLTEQIYLDAKLSNFNNQTDTKAPVLLLGAVSLGNEAVLDQRRDEQAWNVTLVNAQRAQGTWTLVRPDDSSDYRLDRVTLDIFMPEIILNGLFWFSTGQPRVEDALPDLDNWRSSLQSIPLTTIAATDLFPVPVKLPVNEFTVSLRQFPGEAPSALLTSWLFTYEANAPVIQKMVEARVLPHDIFSRYLPLVWRRHPTLPLIQALPLTQSKSPPNYPGTSRQLAPFELPVIAPGEVSIPLPNGWRFGVSGSNGAASWLRFLGDAAPAEEWKTLADLPWVALSLTGLVLDPYDLANETGLGTDQSYQLRLQYRFDVPYTDQLNALAQLPKVPRKPEEVSPLPDSPLPEPPKPLTRETFQAYWQTLSTRASLASADAIEAFRQRDKQTIIAHLVEPYTWPVRPAITLEQYPGSLTIKNADNDLGTITLEGEPALRGISGRFVLKADQEQLERLAVNPDEGNAFLIESGSMAAYHDSRSGAFRDQRGLLRSATQPAARLLKTPVALHQNVATTTAYQLTSALEPANLPITEDAAWQFWFRDLPVQADSSAFNRTATRSSAVEDVNDPEALSREFNYLSGYEWRLGVQGHSETFLSMNGLYFYPLTLVHVQFEADIIKLVKVVGRLQLPLPGLSELENFSNAVCLTFAYDATKNQLRLSAIDLVGPMGEWPLALEGGEATDAPRLEWQKISFDQDLKQIRLDEVRLKFFLFEVKWSLQLEPIVFPGRPAQTITQTYSFALDQNTPLYPQEAALEIDLVSFQHKVSLVVAVQLGNRAVDTGLVALYRFEPGNDPTVVYDVSGVGSPLNLTAQDPAAIAWLPGGGLAIKAPTLIASAGPATKIIEAVQLTNEMTIEAWIKPTHTTLSTPFTPARIVTLSENVWQRNFTLQQGLAGQRAADFYHMRLRTSATAPDRELFVATPAGSLTPELSHVVCTCTALGQMTLYLNGIPQASQTIGDFSNWMDHFRLVLANELTGNRPWLGEYHQLSIYDRALTTAEVENNFQQGTTVRITQPAFRAEVRFPLINQIAAVEEGKKVSWESARLFDDIVLAEEERTVLFTEKALQFSWQKYRLKAGQSLQLLPGMRLATDEIPGFATVTFEILSLFALNPSLVGGLNDSSHPSTLLRQAFDAVGYPLSPAAAISVETPDKQWQIRDGQQNYILQKLGDKINVQAAIPRLKLCSSFLELLIECRWGNFLQDEQIVARQGASPAQVFDSSAGDLMFGYTARWQERLQMWDEAFLLNGFVEVKSLISWPVELNVNSAETILTLPPFDAGQPNCLKHTRHTLRILFNQHYIPADLPVVGAGELIFNLARSRSWQFLAVVEHQLIDVWLDRGLDTISLDNDRRWTTLQEVRLVRPDLFKKFLEKSDPGEILAAPGILNYGYLGAGLRQRLTQSEIDKLPDTMLLVEASAPHWIRQEPVTTISATTLQFLPSGTQLGILSSPYDYSPSSPSAPKWLLLTMPFLGRLQDLENDQLADPAGLSPLQIDPIVYLYLKYTQAPTKPLSELALALSNWSGNHAPTGLVAHYRFEQGDDATIIYDVSGVGSPLHLIAQDPKAINWLAGGGLAVNRSTLLISKDPAAKIIEAIRKTNEISLEVWIKPANITQEGPARIVSISANTSQRNFTLGQGRWDDLPADVYDVRLRTQTSDLNGMPSLTTPPGTLTTDLTQVVYTRTAAGQARIYINGVEALSGTVAGNLDNWEAGFQLMLANETTLNRTWLGEYHQVSIYNRALTTTEVSENFKHGARATVQPGDFVPFEIGVSIFDGPVGRTWPRLDPLSLEENWFRLQNSLPEPLPAGLLSVMAALPNTSARLSRSVALERAFNTFRRVYPPAQLASETLPTSVSGGMLVWRQHRWLVLSGTSTIETASTPPYSWHLTGLVLRGSDLVNSSSGLRRYPAATLVPALLEIDHQENRLPISLAVSPYLGLGFNRGQSQTPQLVSVELLCLDSATNTLLPVASRFMVFDTKDGDPAVIIRDRSQEWARETHLRLTPGSPVAILRFRQINTSDDERLLTTSFAFALVSNIQTHKKLVKRVFRLRPEMSQLRFQEGQFGSAQMPAELLPVEIAPPQTTGVQPLYLTQAPKTTEAQPSPWPWGLSAIRLSVQYTHAQAGMAGQIPDVSSNGSGIQPDHPLVLWWQAPQYRVQYRSTVGSDRPAAGLPQLFRATAIKSLLPVLPNPPMPTVNPTELFSASDQEPRRWQPVLPGLLRYLLVGARPGAMLAWRNQLFRQSGLNLDENTPQLGDMVVSGSVPVQHRMPRPVPLPPNQTTSTALQTWASYFEPQQNLLVTTSPADEAFLAKCGSQAALRLRLILRQPHQGLIPPNWNGDLMFDIASQEALTEMGQWNLSVHLINDTQPFAYKDDVIPVELFKLEWDTFKTELVGGTVTDNLRAVFNSHAIALADEATLSKEEAESVDKWRISAVKKVYLLERDGDKLKIYQNRFKLELATPTELANAGLVAEGLMLVAKIQPKKDSSGFAQVLSFPLRLAGATSLPLPLEPHFIHFEDPEYNRRLVSLSAHSTQNVTVEIKGEPKLHTVTISADRREYNPDSDIALRYDWDEAFIKATSATAGAGRLKLARIDSKGVPNSLLEEPFLPGQLKQFSLRDFKDEKGQPLLRAGDKLQIHLEIKEQGSAVKIETSANLQADIIAEPVTPVPEAGYALLHAQEVADRLEIECARFAWNPAPARIELVCPADLTTEVVRRRAVFQWRHSVRPGRSSRYAIQKITQSGSTHFPEVTTHFSWPD